jgi:hypothetical protein
LAIVLVLVSGSAVAPAAVSAMPRPRGPNRAQRIVHAYVLDNYAYAQAVPQAAPAAVTAFEGAANRIAGECPGVLAGAPQVSLIGSIVPVGMSEPAGSARRNGEAKRRMNQLDDLKSEIDSSLSTAQQAQLNPFRAVLLARLRALPGDPALTQLVHFDVLRLEQDLRAEAPDPCADIRAWVASDYRTLSPASRAIVLKSGAEFAELLGSLSGQLTSGQLSAAEDQADRALAAKTAQLELKAATTIADRTEGALRRLEAALGLHPPVNEIHSRPHESKSSTQIGAGRTAAGTRYTVWLERRKGSSAGGCKSSVEIKTVNRAPKFLSTIESSELGVCLDPPEDPRQPSVNCDEGLLKIEAQVPPSTRTVALRVSDGRQIVSRTVLVPRRLGGPAAFYYQALRGPAPIPVSLIERNAHGHTLQTVKLARVVGCSKHPLKYLPGGKRTLVRGQAPQGPDFSIVGERYRLFGRVHSRLTLNVGGPLESSRTGAEEDSMEGPGELFAPRSKRVTLLDSETSVGCEPHEHSIFYGLLKQSRDTAFAKVSGKLVPLRRVRLPASLHVDGALVYIASSSQPEAIVVRSPSGRTVMNEGRGSRASEGRETCEGESEGPGPAPDILDSIGGETSRIVVGNS